ncbi:MAG: response regulator, partial [Chloroflexi bacterium]|nr:response regulator [Chloroflexota bacterium]
ACKFTQAGEVQVSVAAESPSAHADPIPLHFVVRDTGIGIPPDRVDRLFQVFSQVDASTTRRFGGTGLGLAICKRLTELMGGKIWVESDGVPGKGTAFHFSLSFRIADSTGARTRAVPRTNLRGRTVLVVDDNATNRHILTRMADSWGMRSIVCDSGRSALDKVDGGLDADIALLDVQMPDMDGLALAAELRRRRTEAQLPIVFLSSLGSRVQPPDSVRSAAYLHKPIKPSQLYDALAMVFSEQPAGPAAKPSAEDRFDSQMASRHPLRILLAEDHPVNQKVVRLMLERLGYRADVAGNGLEVLQAFRRQRYDVVLMDIQMPEMNGIECTQNLRRTLQPRIQPRIVALTANALDGERDEYLAAGMDDYLSKPVNVLQLREALERCMQLEMISPAGALDSPAAVPPGPALKRATTTAENAPGEGRAGAGAPAMGSIVVATLKEYFPYQGADVQMVVDLSQEFIADTEERLRRLEAELEQGDADSFGKTAHAIKGASLTFGAETLSALCKEMESQAKSGTLAAARETLARAQSEYSRVRAELPAVLEDMLR